MEVCDKFIHHYSYSKYCKYREPHTFILLQPPYANALLDLWGFDRYHPHMVNTRKRRGTPWYRLDRTNDLPPVAAPRENTEAGLAHPYVAAVHQWVYFGGHPQWRRMVAGAIAEAMAHPERGAAAWQAQFEAYRTDNPRCF